MTNPTTITAQPGTPFLDMIREFEAPPELVWRATSEPDLVVQWLAVCDNDMRIDVWDVRPGGGYRYAHIPPDGPEQVFHGVYHQAVPNKLVIQTFEWAGAPDQVCIEFIALEDLGGGRTRMVSHSVFPSVEAQEAAVASGMEHGMRQSMDQLEDLVATLRTNAA
jgi:uncharacterized protein YndB with AHSA1/START domain